MESHFQEINVTSSLDGSSEPALLYLPKEPKALVVGLHTWSHNRFNQVEAMFPYCRDRGWALVLPEFRGASLVSNPRAMQAGGSALARRDIVDAAKWVIETHFPATPPLFLLGGSGGGHMSLMVAAREDFAWTAVSSWCPITDMAAWHGQNPAYSAHIEAVCGGAPQQSEEVDREYHERSPIHHAAQLQEVRLQVAHGRHDASVPYTHTWLLAEKLADSASFYPWIFDGKHELLYPEAFAFFDRNLGATASASLTS